MQQRDSKLMDEIQFLRQELYSKDQKLQFYQKQAAKLPALQSELEQQDDMTKKIQLAQFITIVTIAVLLAVLLGFYLYHSYRNGNVKVSTSKIQNPITASSTFPTLF